jgi:hypothetical protein
MSGEQAERFRDLLKRRNWRMRSSERGAAITHELWPLLRRFHNLFPLRIAHHKYDGLVIVGDLHRILCDAVKESSGSAEGAKPISALLHLQERLPTNRRTPSRECPIFVCRAVLGNRWHGIQLTIDLQPLFVRATLSSRCWP